MSRFSLNYSNLENKIYKKAYKLSEVKDQLVSVAFDIVKFKDNDSSTNLWQIQSADDGDYIVSLYDQEEEFKTANLWEVDIVKNAKEIQFYYKGDPIVRIASSKLGIPENEIDSVKNYLPVKLNENKKLASALLKELNPSVKEMILKKYPELV